MTDKNTTAKPTGWPKMLIDFGPLVVFFASFKLGDIWIATITFMVACIAAMIASKILYKSVAIMLKVTFVVVMVMGGLTLYLKDPAFVQMKLTIINSFFASILIFGLLRDKLYIKMVMQMAFEMPDKAWHTLTRNYILFLLVMAGLNEIIRREFSMDFWVNFKTFGYMGATMVFMIAHMPMFMKYIPEEEDK